VKKPTVEQRRTEILQVTCDVVIERGFAATRINDVAKKLGVSSSLIHYHFDSKEQLLAEAFAYYARKDLTESEAEIEAAPTAIEQLDRAIHNYVPEGSGDMEWMLWIDGWGEALRNPMMRTISQELDEHSIGLMERVIDHGVHTGEFSCSDPRASAIRITGLVDGLAVQFAAHDGIMDRTDFIRHVRAVAAAEVGVGLADFDQRIEPGMRAPGPATDLALRQLVSRYCDGVIRHDVQTWASTWADDATWQMAADPVVGKDAIVSTWTTAMAGLEWAVHTPALIVFEVDESLGVGSGRVTISERYSRKGTVASLLATYYDDVRRIDGRWLFTSRRLHIHDRH
jgi:AcrR family transcriptional regulator/ketosteroid isomerase-like protein